MLTINIGSLTEINGVVLGEVITILTFLLSSVIIEVMLNSAPEPDVVFIAIWGRAALGTLLYPS
ncbi:MAG: hypothetical protein BWY74_03295 [Firmicutes bacterium ADurb.Bin419]|nr:MAG: hypothetical protein BWY74_03295 [Firmicutes bacterium ADurb.Bin419]